jgi:hypothetical protein
MIDNSRIKIITGHYGSGKTEFAVNYVLKLASDKEKLSLVDLDIVNPYFRSREFEPLLKEKGVKVISSSINAPAVEVPALSAEIFSVFQNKDASVVFDVGGDKAGATVLARYHRYLDKEDFEMFFVINANRPLTNTAAASIKYLKSIEDASAQRITSLISNTHLCGLTSIDDIIKGQELCEEVSAITGLPIKYTLVHKTLANDKKLNIINNEIFPMDIYLKKPWEA